MKHLFAVYHQDVLSYMRGNNVCIQDDTILHRIMHVLRLRVGDELLLFDQTNALHVTLKNISKKNLICELLEKKKNKIFSPHITLYLPILKKDALSQAIYSAVECGVSEIQLIITKHSRQEISLAELDRLKRVIIAAAEQSKYFNFPELSAAMSFETMIASNAAFSLLFDPYGDKARDVFENVASNHINLLFGPEADFSQQEKDLLMKAQWKSCALTPTVLRSVQAVAIGVGLVRSLLR